MRRSSSMTRMRKFVGVFIDLFVEILIFKLPMKCYSAMNTCEMAISGFIYRTMNLYSHDSLTFNLSGSIFPIH